MRPLILYIDDAPELPASAVEALENDGFELRHTADPEDAMCLVEERSPVLVVMEIELTGCEGLHLMAGIRDPQFGSVPVLVATTAPRDSALHGEAIALGVVDFLTKPVRATALLTAIREVTSAPDREGQTAARAAEELSGNLADTPMPELLARLRRRGANGVLTVGHEGIRVGVQLRNGSPVGVSSSRRDLGAEELIYETFRWEEGRFAFSEGLWLESDAMLELTGDPAGLLLAGVLDASPVDQVRERLVKRESLYLSVTDESESALEAEGVAFSREQRKLLGSLGGDDTLSVLLESEAFDERHLYALWVGGWLDLQTAPTLTLTELLGDMPEPELEQPEPLPGERERELAELRRTRAEREREVAELAQTREEREQELEELARTREERERELDELARAREEHEREREALTPALEERAKELEELGRAREEREQELEELARTREERERELDELARAREEHEREREALTPALEERAKELEELGRARDERAQELEDLARTRDEHEQEVERLARARDARAREHQALAPALEKGAQELEELGRAREERERELQGLARMREQHEEELARLARARDARAREHRALAPALEERAQELEERAQELEELGRARAKRAQELEELARMRNEQEQELERLALARAEREREHEALAPALQERAQELEELERARAERAREVEALTRMREEQEQELEELARAREERARELEELACAREERAQELAELERAREESARELETQATLSDPPVPAPEETTRVAPEPASEPLAPPAPVESTHAEPDQSHGELALVGGPAAPPDRDPIGTTLRELSKRVLRGNDFEALGIEPNASDLQVHQGYMAILQQIPEIEPTAANLVHSQQAKRIRTRIEGAYGNLRDAEKRRAYALLQQEEEQDRKAKPSAERALEGERWFRKGKAHLEQKQSEKAAEAFGMAAHLDPEQGEYASHLGYALYLTNPADEVVRREAMEHLASGIKRSPRHELSYVFLGRILKAKGDLDVAKKIFLKALRIRPDFHPAVQELRVLEMRERKSKGVLSRLIRR